MIKKIYNKNKNLILSIAAIGVVAAGITVGSHWDFDSQVQAEENVVEEETFVLIREMPVLDDPEVSGDMSSTEESMVSTDVDADTTTTTDDTGVSGASMDDNFQTVGFSSALDIEEMVTTTEEVVLEEQASNVVELGYTVTAYSNAVLMYTNGRVNVREGAGTDYTRLTTLSWSTPVSVTGVTDNGWYQIDYDDSSAYVSAEYVQESQPATPYIFVGDSRTVQMEAAVGTGNNVWISKVGQGYSWFKKQIDLISENGGSGTKVIINMGVNDLANASKYAKLINSYMDTWTQQGITVYYAAVTPVKDGINVTNAQIESFNATMQSSLDSRIIWIDGYSYLQSVGFSSSDGLHYNNATYKTLYNFYMSTIEGTI